MNVFIQVFIFIAIGICTIMAIFSFVNWIAHRKANTYLRIQQRRHQEFIGRSITYQQQRRRQELERRYGIDTIQAQRRRFDRFIRPEVIGGYYNAKKHIKEIKITIKNNKVYYEGEEILNPEMLGRRIYQKVLNIESDTPIKSIDDIT
jgi:hypothetical protein